MLRAITSHLVTQHHTVVMGSDLKLVNAVRPSPRHVAYAGLIVLSLSLCMRACAVGGGAAQWVDSLSFFLLKRELPLSARAHKRAVFVPDLVLQGLPPVRLIRSLSPPSLCSAH
jgi:hypothetical protein